MINDRSARTSITVYRSESRTVKIALAAAARTPGISVKMRRAPRSSAHTKARRVSKEICSSGKARMSIDLALWPEPSELPSVQKL